MHWVRNYEMKLLQNNGRGNPVGKDQLEIRSKGAVRAYLEKGKKTSYARTGRDKNTKQIHSILYPQFDHIDRDGLNNLRINVREGGGRVNAQNKGKGITRAGTPALSGTNRWSLEGGVERRGGKAQGQIIYRVRRRGQGTGEGSGDRTPGS